LTSAGAAFFSGISVTTTSASRKILATDDAFSRAQRMTWGGGGGEGFVVV
jgi:hypothetical protein